ncbi:hypothetical protein DL770_000426 [Monosporascus sp. CRB-9-2]|nr:hypothetical protein DL770_000426 [Monosporascus sp. CRB-9-2]
MSMRRGGKPKLAPEQIRRTEDLLGQYFDSDRLRRLRRLTSEGMITYGSFGVARKVKFEPRRGAGGNRTADYGDDALENERVKRGSLPLSDDSAVRLMVLKTDLQYARLDENGVAPFKRISESPSEYEYEDKDAVPDNCENEKKWLKVAFSLSDTRSWS